MARNAIHPGEHLAEQLDHLGFSAAELGRRLGLPAHQITALLNNSRKGGPQAPARRVISPNHSRLSFSFAAAFVCHCMLPGASAPPRFNGVTWSIT